MATENTKHDPHEEHVMDHNYDGIQELDNPPPRWIMALFYITIAFSIIYGAYYFWLKQGDHQDAEYARKLEKLPDGKTMSLDEVVKEYGLTI